MEWVQFMVRAQPELYRTEFVGGDIKIYIYCCLKYNICVRLCGLDGVAGGGAALGWNVSEGGDQ